MQSEDESNAEELELLGFLSLFGNLYQYTKNQDLQKELARIRSSGQDGMEIDEKSDSESESSSDEISQDRKMIQELESKLNSLHSELVAERNTFQTQKENMKTEMVNLRTELNKSKKTIKDLEKMNLELLEDVEKFRNELKSLQLKTKQNQYNQNPNPKKKKQNYKL